MEQHNDEVSRAREWLRETWCARELSALMHTYVWLCDAHLRGEAATAYWISGVPSFAHAEAGSYRDDVRAVWAACDYDTTAVTSVAKRFHAQLEWIDKFLRLDERALEHDEVGSAQGHLLSGS